MVETGNFEPGPEVPFLAHSDGALHRSYGARSLEGVMPLQRKDALEYELSSCLSSLGESCPSPTRCLRACPICTVITLAVVELLVGVYGILAGLTKIEVHCERNLQVLMISFGVLQIVQTVGAVGLIFKPKRWKFLRAWFAPALIVAAFAKFVAILAGAALVFGRNRRGSGPSESCDTTLLHETQWYIVCHVVLIASSFCYAILLVHPSYAPQWPKTCRRRGASLEVNRRSQERVQMTSLAKKKEGLLEKKTAQNSPDYHPI
mmetsp:Transcript_19311/g.31468  ORF Transcript_19311/g.31468 Transcript_19311/m.31468 type:complete len:262 (-) Transcript_19311:271-1056(-)